MKRMNLAKIISIIALAFLYNNMNAQIDTVLVTAQKRTEILQKVPIAISTFNSKQAATWKLWNIKDISGIVPNLYSADPGDARNVTSIRGITTTSYDPAVAVYIDGVNQFSLDTYIPDLYDIERIEVLRGPQGTLYGRNAMGGVINIITKDPSDKKEGNASISFGNYGQSRYNLNFKTPLIHQKLYLGVSELYEGRNGYYTNNYNNTSYDKQNGFSGNYFLKYLINSKWTANLNFKHRNHQNNGAFPLEMGVENAIANPYTLNQNALTTMKDNSVNSSLSLQYNGKNFSFSAQTAYQQNYRYYTKPIDGDFSPIDGISVINNYGNVWNNVKVWTQEIKFNSVNNNSSKFKWTTGAYLFSQEAPNKQGTNFGSDATLMGLDQTNFTLINSSTASKKGIALYGQGTYAISNKLNITAGIRNDFEKVDQSVLGEYLNDLNQMKFTTTPLTNKTTDFGAVSPKLTLDYSFNNQQMGYISYNRGFRTGGLSPLTSDPSQPALKRFKPEYSNNYEIGFKNQLFNNHARLNISFFYTQLTDAQVPSLVLPDAVTITKNVGKLNSKGLDIEFIGAINKSFTIQYNFGYTDAKFESLLLAQNGSELNLKGNTQLFTPNFTSNLAAQFDVSISQNIKGFIRSEWKYIGTTYFDLLNQIKQDPYNIVNASVGFNYKKINVQLWARNISKQKYIAYAYDFGAVHLGDPGTFGTTLGFQF